MVSLSPTPTPCNGPTAVPASTRRSAARACSSAYSASKHAHAQIRASYARILAMHALVHASAVKRPSQTPRADSRRLASASGSFVVRACESTRRSARQESLQQPPCREHERAIDDQSKEPEDDDADERILGLHPGACAEDQIAEPVLRRQQLRGHDGREAVAHRESHTRQ